MKNELEKMMGFNAVDNGFEAVDNGTHGSISLLMVCLHHLSARQICLLHF